MTELVLPTACTDWIVPDWPASGRIGALISSRNGGVSIGPWAGASGTGGMNLGARCGDKPQTVLQNRALLSRLLPAEPRWLNQVHGREVVILDAAAPWNSLEGEPQADASCSRQPETVCAILVADCMPVLFCDRNASVVAAAHAGWRGLACGVLEATVAAMRVAPDQIMAYLGPSIGPQAFEVGDEVRAAFVESDPGASSAFRAGLPGKWFADLPTLARRRLAAMGVTAIWGGNRCTVAEPEHFYSYRRDGVTGRMAGLIWLNP